MKSYVLSVLFLGSVSAWAGDATYVTCHNEFTDLQIDVVHNDHLTVTITEKKDTGGTTTSIFTKSLSKADDSALSSKSGSVVAYDKTGSEEGELGQHGKGVIVKFDSKAAYLSKDGLIQSFECDWE